MTEAISRRGFLRGAGSAAAVAAVSTPIWYDWLRNQMLRLRGSESVELSSASIPPAHIHKALPEGDWHYSSSSFRESLKDTLNKVIVDNPGVDVSLHNSQASYSFYARKFGRKMVVTDEAIGAMPSGKLDTLVSSMFDDPKSLRG